MGREEDTKKSVEAGYGQGGGGSLAGSSGPLWLWVLALLDAFRSWVCSLLGRFTDHNVKLGEAGARRWGKGSWKGGRVWQRPAQAPSTSVMPYCWECATTRGPCYTVSATAGIFFATPRVFVSSLFRQQLLSISRPSKYTPGVPPPPFMSSPQAGQCYGALEQQPRGWQGPSAGGRCAML
jgi:hypothetical protein